MEIRTATMDDLDAVSAVESMCFPAAEAATKEEFAERLKYYGDYFILMFDGERLISFIDGFVTDDEDLRDEKYFYNLRTKKSIKCVSADENSSNVQGTIVDGKCYMLVKKAKNWEFLPVDGPDGKYMLGSQYDIADICLGVVIATEQKKNLFGKERNYVCAINFPDMRVIHKEKGKYHPRQEG